MVTIGAGEGFEAVWRSAVSAEVILLNGALGGIGGNEGVKSPNLGSVNCQIFCYG